MNVVAISILSPPHQFVLSHVHEKWPLQCVIQPVWTEQTNTTRHWAKLAKSPLKSLGRKVKCLINDQQAKRLDHNIANLLDNSRIAPSFVAQQRKIHHAELNNDESAEFIRQLKPDVILTSGCPLLHRRIFGIARLATINVHWGIAPGYRGEDTLFWPLYFGDYGHLGVTIHQINKGIDTGPILAHGFPEVVPRDTEATLWAKIAQLTAKLLPEVLATIDRTQTVPALSLQDRGQLFRKRDRTLRHKAAYWVWRKMGRRTPPHIAAYQRVYLNEHAPDQVLNHSDHTAELIES